MKIATLQLLFVALLFSGCSTTRPSISKPIDKYDTTTLSHNVESTSLRVSSASTHVKKAQVHADEAGHVSSRIEAEGTLAHSAEAKTLVANLSQLTLELKDSQDDLTAALLEVSSAKTELAVTLHNRNDIWSQLVDTQTQFNRLQAIAQNDRDKLERARQTVKLETIALIIGIVSCGIYFFLKFYLRIPFL